MRHSLTSSIKILVILFGLAIGNTEGGAQGRDTTVRKVPAMSLSTHKQIQKAQEAMALKDYVKSHTLLDALLAQEKVNDYERAVAWQLKAMLAFEQNSTPATIEAYEKILTYAQSIPVALEVSIIYGLSQLYYSEEDYDAALRYVKTWETRVDPSRVRFNELQYISNLHYVREEYQLALNYMDATINLFIQHSHQPVPLRWYQFMVSANWELGNKIRVDQILEERLAADPQAYWCHLKAGILKEMGQTEEEALATARKAAPVCADISDTVSPRRKGDKTPGTEEASASNDGTADDKVYLPVNRAQPKYPRKAVEENIEGYVLLELTVLPDGSVDKESIVVLESSPKGHFEETAVETAAKFLYKPKQVDGLPQKIKGVKYRFSFSIAD